MIKRLTNWQSREDVTIEDALHHWSATHAALVAQVPEIRRYVQNHCVEGPEGGHFPYTGLGEIWFEDFESARFAMSTPEWALVIEDARTFMDFSTVVAAWATEHEPSGGPKRTDLYPG